MNEPVRNMVDGALYEIVSARIKSQVGKLVRERVGLHVTIQVSERVWDGTWRQVRYQLLEEKM